MSPPAFTTSRVDLELIATMIVARFDVCSMSAAAMA